MLVQIDQALECSRKGEVFAIPTDTVYGIAAAIDCQEAIDAIYQLKGRDTSKQLIMLASSTEEIKDMFDECYHSYIDQASGLWPGALSLILPCKENVLGYSTLGVRIPNHSVALELLKRTGPLYVTSANPSGKEAAQSPEVVAEYFGEAFPILDGKVKDGVPSTIIKVEDEKIRIIREGLITLEQLAKSFPGLKG